MENKKKIQAIISLIFFGITAYVLLNFFVFSKNDEPEAGGNEIDSAEASIKELKKKSFKTEETEIFEDPKFKELKENPLTVKEAKKNEIGKSDPFEKRSD